MKMYTVGEGVQSKQTSTFGCPAPSNSLGGEHWDTDAWNSLHDHLLIKSSKEDLPF